MIFIVYLESSSKVSSDTNPYYVYTTSVCMCVYISLKLLSRMVIVLKYKEKNPLQCRYGGPLLGFKKILLFSWEP